MIPLFIFIFFFTVVHFGQVTVREFQRRLGGGGGIPVDHGGWALGLGTHVRDFHAGSIEEIEIRKDKIIQDKLNQQKRRNNSGSHDSKSPKNNTTTMKITKILKPQALTQDQRKELFRKDLVDANVFERLTKRESFDEEEKQKVKQEKRQQHGNKQKKKKNTHHHNKSNNNKSNNNNGLSTFEIPTSSVTSSDTYHNWNKDEEDTLIASTRPRLDSHEMLSQLQAVNQEIIKDTNTVIQSREHKHQGCRCTRKMMSKMNEKTLLPRLLTFHNLNTEAGSRGTLSRRYVAEVVDKIGLCVDAACECVQSGIGCHHATCACVCTSNFVPLTPRKSRRMSMDGGGGTDESPAPTLVVKCANSLGKYKYDESTVFGYRKAMLKDIQHLWEMDKPM